MKVLHGLCLLLLVACLEARPEELRPELTSSRCPAVDPLKYTVHLPHPADCNMFLRCDHGIAKPERCPAHLHFNPVLQVCDWPANAGCAKVYGPGPGGSTEWNVDSEPQVEDPGQETPTLDIVPENGTPDEYIPADWFGDADVQNEAAVEDAGGDDGNPRTSSVDDEDIFDANIEYATKYPLTVDT